MRCAMFRDGVARVLVFRLGAERFAVSLAAVDEVVEPPPVHPLPDAAAGVLGVASLRGELVPIFDTGVFLHVSRRGESGAVLLFAREERRVGLAIDDVYDAITVEESEVMAVPGSEASDGILRGVVRRGSELIAVLDIDALLDAATMVSQGEMT